MSSTRLRPRLLGAALLLAALCLATVQAEDLERKYRLMSLNAYTQKVYGSSVSASTSCLACTLLLGLLNQNALQTNESPSTIIQTFCSDITNPAVKPACQLLYDLAEKFGLDKIDPSQSPEVNCQQMKLCPIPAQCVLFNNWPPWTNTPNPVPIAEAVNTPYAAFLDELEGPEIPSDTDFWATITNALQIITTGNSKDNINDIFNLHVPMPADDVDNDRFAIQTALRGTSWRGRDCNDNDATIYPGRQNTTAAANVDHNCNGIHGSSLSNQSYEELFCGKYAPTSTVIIGDSATAHFSIPPVLLTPSQVFNASNWPGVLHLAANEADWPECSWATGWESDQNCPPFYTNGSFESFYTMMRSRNLCNHRNYQNAGVNGARTENVAPPNGDIMQFARDQENDDPALVFYALIGNDVCNGHPGFGSMSTPEEFAQGVVSALQYLDTQLPMGSHVVFLPLADGLLLHEVLSNRTHPIGVPYQDVYDFLICYGKAPCLGWMTSNATFRNMTQERANELSAVYPQIIANYTFKHFDMAAVPATMMGDFVSQWVAEGHDPALLIEPVDGFHPSTTAGVLTAQYVWNWLMEEYPSFIPAENPYNADIIKIFGNQGGY